MSNDRKLTDWLTSYQSYIVKHESPDIYHTWNGLFILSCAVRRNIWIELDTHKIFSNLYMFLIAESGLCRKSVATDIGYHLLQEVQKINTEIVCIHEKATPEGLIGCMKRTIVRNTKIIPDGSVCIFADELANLFCKASYAQDLITFLTSAYGCRSRFEFVTKKYGISTILNACICLHANCTPEQLGDVFKEINKSSGFLGRVILVSGNSERRFARPTLKKEIEKDLVNDLHSISMIYGKLSMNFEADSVYTSWYESLAKNAPKNVLPAFWERYHDFVLKISSLLSISESSDMIIKLNHLQKATSLIDNISKEMGYAMRYIGANENALIMDKIIKAILSCRRMKGCKRSEIMQLVCRYVVSSEHLSQILQVMEESDQITSEVDGRVIYYKIKLKENFNDYVQDKK